MVVGSLRQETDLVIVGGGPGGYVAALRAADLGLEVLLVEQQSRLGGTCLLEGCIPSKSLIHAVGVAESARQASELGLSFSELSMDLDRLRAWARSVVEPLARGVAGLLGRRGVEVIQGRARLVGPHELAVEGGPVSGITFRSCILATGSSINELPQGVHPSVWSSADALQLPRIPETLLVVGGGYIGLELGLVYAGLGARVTVAELGARLLGGADPDLVEVVERSARERFAGFHKEARVTGVEPGAHGFAVSLQQAGAQRFIEFEQVLVAAGRRPNTRDLGLERVGLNVDRLGRLRVNPEGRTQLPHIFAIGDIAPGPMLAHKASHEGKIAAEVLAGRPAALDHRSIPAVVFTDPEIAWTGVTEEESEAYGLDLAVTRFPLRALGRARTLGRDDGLVKLIYEPETKVLRGVGMVGPGVSELIAEGTLAIELGATLEDLIATIHPHPTLSEGLMEAAELAIGHPIHVPSPRGGPSAAAGRPRGSRPGDDAPTNPLPQQRRHTTIPGAPGTPKGGPPRS